MQLTQPEIIQILRRRADLNQGQLGAKAFNLPFESGRTKIKNLELGRQTPTMEDLNKIAVVLGVDPSELTPGPNDGGLLPHTQKHGSVIYEGVFDLFPGLEQYIDMLNKAVTLEDTELVKYLSCKISNIFSSYEQQQAADI